MSTEETVVASDPVGEVPTALVGEEESVTKRMSPSKKFQNVTGWIIIALAVIMFFTSALLHFNTSLIRVIAIFISLLLFMVALSVFWEQENTSLWSRINALLQSDLDPQANANEIVQLSLQVMSAIVLFLIYCIWMVYMIINRIRY
tara:strand:- start:707 stop:1144 length:438 start_codon:yes stop_codon:yes gene_type:complete